MRSGARPSVAHSESALHRVGIEHPSDALVGHRRVDVAVLDHDLAALERRPHDRGHVVGAICRVEQRLGARRDVAAMVQDDLADLDADLGAAGLPGAHDDAPLGRQPRPEQFRLRGLA